jgi:allophanate hydrolase
MIEIIETGPFNTVQDLGRPGYRDIGVSSSGAMDPLAVRIGNSLVGNDEGAAMLEIQTFPFRLRFDQRCTFVVAGTDGNPLLDGVELLAWCAYGVEAGQVLELSQPPKLARTYVCVAGGLDVPSVMGSRSLALPRVALAAIPDGRWRRAIGSPSGRVPISSRCRLRVSR